MQTNQMTGRIKEIWALTQDPPAGATGLFLRRFHEAAGPDVHLGHSAPERKRLIALRLPRKDAPSGVAGVKLRGLSVDLVTDTSPAHALLTLTLDNLLFADLFDVLLADIIPHVERAGADGRARGQAFVTRLQHWRALFDHFHPEGLTLAQRRGLFGELVIIRVLLDAGHDPWDVLQAWTGPLGAARDFTTQHGAIEVKTTGSGDAAGIHISNGDQLDSSKLNQLYLCRVVIAESATGQSLNDLVDLLRQATAGAAVILNERLAHAGYHDIHRSQYSDVHYTHQRTDTYHVQEGFPRLTPHSIPPGITGVEYTIDPGALSDFLVASDTLSTLFSCRDA